MMDDKQFVVVTKSGKPVTVSALHVKSDGTCALLTSGHDGTTIVMIVPLSELVYVVDTQSLCNAGV